MQMYITTLIVLSLPELFTNLQSPSHSDICQFKITILAPLQWAQHFQVLGYFPLPIPSVCVLTLACDPCPIILMYLF
jgi:hypothetical protein